MPEIKTKVSLYFPKDLFGKFEKLRQSTENNLGIPISKNEFALKLITDALNNKCSYVAELSPEYQTALLEKSDDEIIQFILDELKDLRAAIENLEKDKN